MVSLGFFFLFLVTLFAIIGAMRGWARELLVTFSVILSMFIITVMERYVPAVTASIAIPGSSNQFWLRALILLILVFFGYQTPNLPRLAGQRFVRERFQDTLLGLFLGALNGYLVVGTLWLYMHQAGYPFGDYITPPQAGTPMGDAAFRMLEMLPPRWLGPPMIFFAVALAFIFVIVVFL
jgi:uncharacterized membrane protein required for colicin V production